MRRSKSKNVITEMQISSEQEKKADTRSLMIDTIRKGIHEMTDVNLLNIHEIIKREIDDDRKIQYKNSGAAIKYKDLNDTIIEHICRYIEETLSNKKSDLALIAEKINVK